MTNLELPDHYRDYFSADGWDKSRAMLALARELPRIDVENTPWYTLDMVVSTIIVGLHRQGIHAVPAREDGSPVSPLSSTIVAEVRERFFANSLSSAKRAWQIVRHEIEAQGFVFEVTDHAMYAVAQAQTSREF